MSDDPAEAPLSAVLWQSLRKHAQELVCRVPSMSAAIQSQILDRTSFGEALVHVLTAAMVEAIPQGLDLAPLLLRHLRANPHIAEQAAADLQKLNAINPACLDLLTGFISFRGFLGLQLYRFNHAMWVAGEQQLAVLLQNWGAMKFAMDAIRQPPSVSRSFWTMALVW
jgi:serine O-acetyltransferase